MNVSGKTKVCAIIGDPIDHTMSPPMHNAAYKELGLDYIYLPFQVKKEHLKQAVAGLKALNVRGFNVTMPHKVSIIPMLDGLDPLAEKIGAVNTVVNDKGVLTGHNTDGLGVLQALLEKGLEPEGKKVVVIGAGGAYRWMYRPAQRIYYRLRATIAQTTTHTAATTTWRAFKVKKMAGGCPGRK